MKKYIATALFINVCFSLLTVSAQITGDQAPTQADRQCTDLAYNLTYRKSKDSNTNGEVSDLQSFLQDQRLLNSDPTGNFGALTLRAVKTFQSKNGLLSSGYVGVYTRAMIKEVSCAFSTNQPATASGFFATTKIVSVKLEDAKVVFSGINLMALLKEYPDLYLKYKADCAFRSVCSGELEQASSDYYSTSFYINKDFKDLNSNGNIDVQIFDKKTGKSLSEVFSVTSKSSTLLPSVVLNMSPTTPEYGKSSTIFWTSTESTSCSYVGGEMNAVKGNSLGTSGSFRTQELTENKKYSVTCYGKGGHTTASLEIKVPSLNQSTSATIVTFGNKDPNPITGATTIMWRTSKAVTTYNGSMSVTLDVSCDLKSISFTTDRGSKSDCAKGGVWSWSGATEDSITVTPVGNSAPVTVPFTLTVYDQNGDYSKRKTQTINITFPATKVSPVSTNSAPSIEFLSAPTLKLQYDSANKESMLVGEVTARITAGDKMILNLGSYMPPLAIKNGSGVYTYTNSAIHSTVQSKTGDQYGSPLNLPAHKSVTVVYTMSIPTREMFGGSYFLTASDWYYQHEGGIQGSTPISQIIGQKQSGYVTVVGETSPYITGSQVSQKDPSVYYIFGKRFSSTVNAVTINGITKSLPTDVLSEGIIFSVKDFNITTSGTYVAQVSVNGQASNRLGVTITAPQVTTTVLPTVEFLSTPTLKLQYDSTNKESLLVGQAVIKITTGASSFTLPTDSNLNPVVYVYSLMKNTNGATSFVNLNSGKFVTISSLATGAVIPPNTSVTFTVTYTAKPVDMYAGTYQLMPTDMYYLDQNGSGITFPKSSIKNAANSNSLTVVGESVYLQMPPENGGYDGGNSGGGGEGSGGSGASRVIQSSLAQLQNAIDQGKSIMMLLSGATHVSAASCTTIARNIHRGDESSVTSKLQEFLIAKGFLSEKATGFFGDFTIEAVKAYQRSVGLKETGMVYDLTRQAILAETCQ